MPFGYYCMSTCLSMSAYIGSHRPSIPSRNKPVHPSVVPPPVDFSCLFSCPKGTTGNLSRLCDTPPSRPCHMDSGMELLSTRLAQLVVARTVSTTQTFPSRDSAALISSIDMLSGRMAQLPPTSPGLAEARSRKRVSPRRETQPRKNGSCLQATRLLLVMMGRSSAWHLTVTVQPNLVVLLPRRIVPWAPIKTQTGTWTNVVPSRFQVPTLTRFAKSFLPPRRDQQPHQGPLRRFVSSVVPSTLLQSN